MLTTTLANYPVQGIGRGAMTDGRATPVAAPRQAERPGDPRQDPAESDRLRVTPPMPYAEWLRMLSGYHEHATGNRATPDAA